MQRGDCGAGDGGTEVGLEDDQRDKNQGRNDGGQNRVAPVVHGFRTALQEKCQKQNERRLGHFGGLKGERTQVNPAMRVVGAIEEEDRDQQQRGQAEQREDHRGMLVAAVIDLHGDHHGQNSGRRPDHLPQQKEVAGAVALLRHDGRGAEHHDQPDEDQEQGDREQPAIDTDALCHGEDFISPRRHEAADGLSSDDFAEGFNSFGSPARPAPLRLL